MAKVTLIQVIYEGMRYIPQSFDSMMNQTFKDVDYVAVICGNEDGGKEYIESHYPQVRIIDPGENLMFARGHNLVFNQYQTEFFQLVNQDLILEPNYVEEMLKVFADPLVGAATGKLLKFDFQNNKKLNTYDTTGVVVSKNGRARDRGQHEEDRSQYDTQTSVVAVSGAGPMYRRSALEAVKMPRISSQNTVVSSQVDASKLTTDNLLLTTSFEYFDADFVHSWEDVDLSLRLQNAGWECAYVPKALGYHGRTSAASEEGYKNVAKFVQHHKTFSSRIKELNYKNHMFVVVKNFPRFYWKFFVREIFMLGFITVFETKTLRVIPVLLRELPRMWQKRKWIQKHRKTVEWVKLLNNKGLLS